MRFLYLLFVLFLLLASKLFAEISVEQVYWWWDDGLIEYGEADDLLLLIESGDEEGACIYADALGLEKCELARPRKKQVSSKKKTPKIEKKNWGGSVRYQESRDSSDALLLRKLETKLHYEAFAFRGIFSGETLENATWQLAYRRDGYEALLGEIRYGEIGINFPLEVREGTWLAYDGELLKLGGALFTDSAVAANVGVHIGGMTLDAWTFDDSKNRAVAIESSNENFAAGVWYARGMESPLYRASVDFKSEGKFKILWNGLFYALEDSILPYPLKLPASVRKSRFWASQTQKFLYSDYGVALVERLQIPLDTGRALPYVSATIQKSKGLFRMLAGVACRDAGEGCGRPQFRAEPGFAYGGALFYSKLRLQGESFNDLEHSPRVAVGVKYTLKQDFGDFQKGSTFFRSEFVVPERGATERSPYKFNEDAGISLKNISASIRLVFIKRPEESFKAERAGITAEMKF